MEQGGRQQVSKPHICTNSPKIVANKTSITPWIIVSPCTSSISESSISADSWLITIATKSHWQSKPRKNATVNLKLWLGCILKPKKKHIDSSHSIMALPPLKWIGLGLLSSQPVRNRCCSWGKRSCFSWSMNSGTFLCSPFKFVYLLKQNRCFKKVLQISPNVLHQ